MAADIKKAIKKDISKSSPDDIRAIKTKSKFFVPFMLMLPALIFFSLFTILPLFKVIIDSFNNTNVNFSSTFSNVWMDSEWYISIFNSLIYSLISVPATLAVALLISFTISNIIRKRFREFWQTIFFIPYITSTIAVSIVFSELFNSESYGIINWILGSDNSWLDTPYNDSPIAFIPVVLFGIWHSLAFKVLILTSAMLTIDKRLYDAAALDGASKKDMFFNITVPGLNATIWYLITIGLIGSLKVFPLALFNNSYDKAMDYFPTMLTYVYSAVKGSEFGRAGAASISLIFVIIGFNWMIRKGMYGIQNYFTNKKENDVKKEIRNYEVQIVSNTQYSQEKTSEFMLSLDTTISDKKNAQKISSNDNKRKGGGK